LITSQSLINTHNGTIIVNNASPAISGALKSLFNSEMAQKGEQDIIIRISRLKI